MINIDNSAFGVPTFFSSCKNSHLDKRNCILIHLSKTSTCYCMKVQASYGTRKNSAFEKENEENRELSLDRQNSIHKKCKINNPVSSTKNLENIKGSAKGLLKRFRLNGHTI